MSIKDIAKNVIEFITLFISSTITNKTYVGLNNKNSYLNENKFKFEITDEIIETAINLITIGNTGNVKDEKSQYSFCPEVFIQHEGWYFHGLASCFWVLYRIANGENTKYFNLIKEIINLGGDTDTNAAIVGGVIGPLFGLNNFPKDLFEILIGFNSVTTTGVKRDFIYSPISSLVLSNKMSEYIYEDNILNKSNKNNDFLNFKESDCNSLALLIDFVNNIELN